MNNYFHRVSVIALGFAMLCISACATVQPIQSIPKPPPSAKLRVFMMAVSGQAPKGGWKMPQEQFNKNLQQVTSRFLQDTGIYDVVPEEDLVAVLGKQTIEDWQWLDHDMDLVKRAGRALHADYAVIAVRTSITGNDYANKMICLNLESGKEYADSFYEVIKKGASGQEVNARRKRLIRRYYRKMFYDLRQDMLATAVRKARLMPEGATGTSAPLIISKKDSPVIEDEEESGGEVDSPIVTARIPPSVPREAANRADEKKRTKKAGSDAGQDKSRVVVYDLDATGTLSVVSLILTEALREELFALGRITLVNRENMLQVLQEYKLQQAGMVDEKQAVELGKWLAANEAVTGRLALLGSAYVLQVKRTDIKTLETLGMESLRSTVGKEDDLLIRMPDLAKKLMELKK